jgi:hypothetical protein
MHARRFALLVSVSMASTAANFDSCGSSSSGGGDSFHLYCDELKACCDQRGSPPDCKAKLDEAMAQTGQVETLCKGDVLGYQAVGRCLPGQCLDIMACNDGQTPPNGHETGAFEREFTKLGFTSISAQVTIPYFDLTQKCVVNPYIYYVFWTPTAKMEVGLAWQAGGTAGKPPRLEPYVSSKQATGFQGCSNCTETQGWVVNQSAGSTVTMSAWYDGSRVHISINGFEPTFQSAADNAIHFDSSQLQIGRVVGNAVVGYNGGYLASIGPVVFTNTLVGYGVDTIVYDTVLCDAAKGGCADGADAWPDCQITAQWLPVGNIKTITLF